MVSSSVIFLSVTSELSKVRGAAVCNFSKVPGWLKTSDTFLMTKLHGPAKT